MRRRIALHVLRGCALHFISATRSAAARRFQSVPSARSAPNLIQLIVQPGNNEGSFAPSSLSHSSSELPSVCCSPALSSRLPSLTRTTSHNPLPSPSFTFIPNISMPARCAAPVVESAGSSVCTRRIQHCAFGSGGQIDRICRVRQIGKAARNQTTGRNVGGVRFFKSLAQSHRSLGLLRRHHPGSGARAIARTPRLPPRRGALATPRRSRPPPYPAQL